MILKADDKENKIFALAAVCYAAEGTVETQAGGNGASSTVETDIRDIKGLMAQNIEKTPLLPFALKLAILALAIFAVYRALKRPAAVEAPVPEKEEPAPPRIPPHITALEDLERLMASGLLDAREYKAWFTEISRICRVYTGDSLEFNCVDFANYEIVSCMKSQGARRAAIDELEFILNECDLVKFARFSPNGFDAREIYKKAVEFIKATQEGKFK